MDMPRFIPADKANHRVRGAEVASVAAALVMLLTALAMLLLGIAQTSARQTAAVLVLAAVTAAGAAWLAGVLVEKRQAGINAAAVARGEPAPHAIEDADITATARGALPVVVPLLVLALLSVVMPR